MLGLRFSVERQWLNLRVGHHSGCEMNPKMVPWEVGGCVSLELCHVQQGPLQAEKRAHGIFGLTGRWTAGSVA